YDLARNPTAAVALGFPLYTLVRTRNKRTCPASIRQRLFLGELPRESVLETEHGFLVTSPLLTIFIMSRHLTDLQLLLVLAEMCGLFAVCALPAALEAELSRAIDSGAISTTFGWVRCPSEDGIASNLWRRDALVLGGDLDRFCSDVCGMRCGNRFMAVSQLVPLGAASPFEVEAYLLLGLPRALGGEGFCGIELNVEVMLNTSARAIVEKSRVYIDLLLSSPDGRRQVAIECQGKASHGRAGDGLRDADRMTALQAMGYDVLLLTHRQISDEDRFRAIVKAICRMLDAEYRDKSSDEQRAETLLRSELFVDWTKLGVIDGKMPVRHKTAQSWTAAVLSE
ncbi:MAG: hypothetical protein UFD57_08710, partial [Collinsella sp.]|nr:hypothetical protein [Collinsella sp.]